MPLNPEVIERVRSNQGNTVSLPHMHCKSKSMATEMICVTINKNNTYSYSTLKSVQYMHVYNNSQPSQVSKVTLVNIVPPANSF